MEAYCCRRRRPGMEDEAAGADVADAVVVGVAIFFESVSHRQ